MEEEKSPKSYRSRQYRRGADFERKVKKDYEARGWFVQRAAGSHGPADLVCLYPAGRLPVALVQCKRDGKISQSDREKLRYLAETYHCEAVLAYRGERADDILYEVIA